MVALLATACSNDGSTGASALSPENADDLATAILLQPNDIGPGFVDDTDSISKAGSLADCLGEESDAQPLAESPIRSFKSPEIAEDPSQQDLERAVQDIQSVTVTSAVFSTEADASNAIASLTDFGSARCTGDMNSEALIPLDPLSVGDESVVFAAGEGNDVAVAISFARTGPVVTFVVSLRFDGEVNRDIMETVVSTVAREVENAGI